MTAEDRVKAVVEFGFTKRQARFLVTVMLHSGVCLLRQYTAFAGIAHGQKTRAFFRKLVSRRYATAYPCRHNRGRVYHVHHKALYRAIGETESRHRRPLSAARVVEGLMLLDAVLASPELVWLVTEEEKRTHLAALTAIATDKLPHAAIGGSPSPVVRLFPDKVPIGIDLNGRWLLVYVVANDRLDEFRGFLQRHGDLLCALSSWTLRIVVPPHLDALAEPCQELVRQELTSPLPDLVNQLRWYFKQRQAISIEAAPIQDEESYYEARFAFRATRFQVLYRRWLSQGDAAFDVVSSRAIADAIAHGTGRLECHVLPHQYRHLSPLVGLARRASKGAEEGEGGGSRPRPPVASSDPVLGACSATLVSLDGATSEVFTL